MRQAEGNADDRLLVRAQPFIRQIAGRTKLDAFIRQFLIQLLNHGFQRRIGDVQVEVLDPNVEQFVIAQVSPVQDVFFSGHTPNIPKTRTKIKKKRAKELSK